MRAFWTTRFGVPRSSMSSNARPVPGEGQRPYDVSTADVNYAETHQVLSPEVAPRPAVTGKL